MATIEENMNAILKLLSVTQNDSGKKLYYPAKYIGAFTSLSPSEINTAVALLVQSGFVKWFRMLGTAPYKFYHAEITPKGQYEVERLMVIESEQGTVSLDGGENLIEELMIGEKPLIEEKSYVEIKQKLKPPIPQGSPYGFTKYDWERIAIDNAKSNVLIVTLGYQGKSDYYDSEWLIKNIKKMFEDTIEVYNSDPENFNITLDFRPLESGYGEHLFNQIAADIISSDIAVFETSDKNTNVYLEMGVALTNGVRVHPIKKAGTEKPTSDISGHTYADYENDGQFFVKEDKDGKYVEDPNQQLKLLRLIDKAIRNKVR